MSSNEAFGSYHKEEMTQCFHPGRDVGFLPKGNTALTLFTERNGNQPGHSKSQLKSGTERC